MNIELISFKKLIENENILYVTTLSNYKNLPLTTEELKYVEEQVKVETSLVEINKYTHRIFVHVATKTDFADADLEKMRKLGNSLHARIQEGKISKITLVDHLLHAEAVLALIEGISLTNYQFIKYLKDTNKVKHSLKSIALQSDVVTQVQIDKLNALTDGVKFARELVNEPLSYLTAEKLSEEIKKMGDEAGFCVEVFGMKKIQSLKMGGLLAVNKGSLDAPTFSILEWKPENAKNVEPVVLVGKGVVYDTGGLSLKPTKDRRSVGAGAVVWAPAGAPHGVRNEGAERLTLLVCIAPPP